MDPLVQGLLGASASQSFAGRVGQRSAFWLGLLGRLAPDLDVFIRSDEDPLLALQFHRHFTHSLVIIPVGGFLVTCLVYPFVRKFVTFPRAYLYATLGWATHGLLDACTNYGTQLLWPFSNLRVSWNSVAIVDPIVTLALLIGVIWSLRSKARWPAQLGFLSVLAYLGLGVVQRERAQAALETAAIEQGLAPTRLSVKPTVLNNILFRGLFEANDQYYVSAVRVPWFGSGKVSQFRSVPVFNLGRDLPQIPEDSVHARDVDRFSWFSDGYLSAHPKDPLLIGDLRFSMLPDRLEPMWAIRLNPLKPNAHVTYESYMRSSNREWNAFFSLLKGNF